MKTLQVAISHDQWHRHDQEIFVNKTAVSMWQLNIRYKYSLKFLFSFCLLENHASEFYFIFFVSTGPVERHQSIISFSTGTQSNHCPITAKSRQNFTLMKDCTFQINQLCFLWLQFVINISSLEVTLEKMCWPAIVDAQLQAKCKGSDYIHSSRTLNSKKLFARQLLCKATACTKSNVDGDI